MTSQPAVYARCRFLACWRSLKSFRVLCRRQKALFRLDSVLVHSGCPFRPTAASTPLSDGSRLCQCWVRTSTWPNNSLKHIYCTLCGISVILSEPRKSILPFVWLSVVFTPKNRSIRASRPVQHKQWHD